MTDVSDFGVSRLGALQVVESPLWLPARLGPVTTLESGALSSRQFAGLAAGDRNDAFSEAVEGFLDRLDPV